MPRPSTGASLALLTLLAGACAAPPTSFPDREAAWRRQEEAFQAGAVRQLPEQPTVQDLLEVAEARNPDIQAAFQAWRAALEQVVVAGQLPDPRLSLTAYLQEVETRVGPMQARASLTQAFPWFGILRARSDAAFAAAEATRELLEQRRLEVRESILETWYEYTWLHEAILITEGHLELLRHLEEVARTLYETGRGPHSDLIRAQVELGRVADRLRTLEDLRQPLVARLNAALDRPPGAPIPWPGEPLPEPPPEVLQTPAAPLEESSPELRALRHRIAAAEQGVLLAEKAFWPDFALGLDYTFVGPTTSPGVSGSGDDALGLTLGLELPIYRGRLRAGLAGAEAAALSARAALAAARNRLAADLEMALYQARDGDRRVQLFRDNLVPKGNESFQSSLTAYQGDEVPFDTVVDAERVLLEFQLAAVRAAADRAQALALAERITGTPILDTRP